MTYNEQQEFFKNFKEAYDKGLQDSILYVSQGSRKNIWGLDMSRCLNRFEGNTYDISSHIMDFITHQYTSSEPTNISIVLVLWPLSSKSIRVRAELSHADISNVILIGLGVENFVIKIATAMFDELVYDIIHEARTDAYQHSIEGSVEDIMNKLKGGEKI